MGVSLRQLEYFITVVDEGSFTRAAERLDVSQPGLSHQIQALERELGGPLLERLPRKVRLTPAGRTALPHARASLAHAQRASSAARRASGVETGELHVGTLYSISTGVLPGALRTWRRSYPELQVHLVEFPHTDELVAAMEAGGADVAVGPTPPAWEGPCRTIGDEEFVIAAAPDQLPYPDGARVPVTDLAEQEWVHYTARSGLADILNRTCEQAGFTPRLSVRTEQSPSALSLARAGIGLALLPGNIVPPHFDGILLRPDPPVLRPLAVYTRVRPDPITAAFVSAISVETLVTPTHITDRLGALQT
ncbi:LysR family transcriptional regulator [Streptacidiphilus albus]|uniref:LysR family transcriptional regulator n=1 Tax=Streptacidiphilus albus TaxID=105425 RepID=UPI00054C1AFA|nr:LysR family transcriptional regulator [Streptacidiphilus albus]